MNTLTIYPSSPIQPSYGKHGYPTESKISTSKFLALMIPLEYLALLTFSLTSNAKTVLTKVVNNPINVKSFQEKMRFM